MQKNNSFPWVATPLAIAISSFSAGNALASVTTDTSFGVNGIASLGFNNMGTVYIHDAYYGAWSDPVVGRQPTVEMDNGDIVSFAPRYEEVGSVDFLNAGYRSYCTHYTSYGIYYNSCSRYREYLFSGYLTSGTSKTRMSRFTAGGAPVSTVDIDGVIAVSALKQADGKLVLMGNDFKRAASSWSYYLYSGYPPANPPPQTSQIVLQRFNADSSPDISFDGDGTLRIGLPGTRQAKGLALTPDGKIIVLSTDSNLTASSPQLWRFNSDGSVDTSFGGGDGNMPLAIPNAWSMLEQQDNKLLVQYKDINNQAYARFNTDGTLDSSFAGDGTLNLGQGFASYAPMLQQASGKLLFAAANVYRYDLNGTYEQTFTIPADAPATLISLAETAAGEVLVARGDYQNNGKIDVFYGDGARNTTVTLDQKEMPYVQGSNGSASGNILLQSNGLLLASGNVNGTATLNRHSNFTPLGGDTDNDGIATPVDNCPAIANTNQLNTDGDGLGDVCDPDDDNDAVVDNYDVYPLDASRAGDIDNDGVEGVLDNCPGNANANQLNTDGDALGDVCDADDDNDTIPDPDDNCPIISNVNQLNSDGDVLGDVCDSKPYELTKALSIVAGDTHTCVLTTEGGVECWGRNDYGQLGDNTTTPRLAPVAVNGLSSGVTALASGGFHTCALTAQGAVLCWGSNDYGQLGDNGLTTQTVPVNVNGLGSGAIAIAAGQHHTCALTIQGGVKCWGRNDYGQLGDNTTTGRLAPVAVNGLSSGIAAITAGYSYSCALTTQGAVLCWGANFVGMLGDNTTTQKLTPVAVNGLSSGVAALTARNSHTCALTIQGSVLCWGWNAYGQLGDNSTTSRLTPVNVSGLGSGMTAFSAGAVHTCALTIQGAVLCWGRNNFGQLGDSTTIQRLTPVPVSGFDSGVIAIAAGWSHSCAVTTIGSIQCWGDNQYGQLGDNTTTTRLTPVYVKGFSNDSDNDGMPDTWELLYGFNPLVNDATGDFDSDGITNLQEYINGSNPQAAAIKNDYNNDSIAGWIWKGVSNGNETSSQIWQLTFPLFSANWSIPARSYPPQFLDQPNWDIVTSGDFNRDGDADILWRNNITAQWKIWQMQNGTRSAQNDLADFDLAHEWIVVGAGDTDQDGDDDVILNNTTTGEVQIREMQNNAVTATHSVGTKAGYTLSRIGDFNKDGDVDLLFRQNDGGALITWELETNAYVAERSLNSTGAGYNPVCAGDFDKDGDDDIMFINSTTQQEKWFVMENYSRTQKVGALNTGFSFLGCGDYDGDGDSDSLWQRTADNKIRAVLQQGYGVTKQTVYTNAFGGVNGFVYRGNGN